MVRSRCTPLDIPVANRTGVERHLEDDLAKTQERRERIIRRVAREIKARRLVVPARWFLEMHLPLSNVLYNGWLFFLPTISPILGKGVVESLSEVLESKENLARLVELLGDQESGELPREVGRAATL